MSCASAKDTIKKDREPMPRVSGLARSTCGASWRNRNYVDHVPVLVAGNGSGKTLRHGLPCYFRMEGITPVLQDECSGNTQQAPERDLRNDRVVKWLSQQNVVEIEGPNQMSSKIHGQSGYCRRTVQTTIRHFMAGDVAGGCPEDKSSRGKSALKFAVKNAAKNISVRGAWLGCIQPRWPVKPSQAKRQPNTLLPSSGE